MTATVVWILDKIITAIIFLGRNTKEQALLLNKSNNKITVLYNILGFITNIPKYPSNGQRNST